MLTDVEKERQRCIRCVELNDPKDGSFASRLLLRIRNAIASGKDPLTFDQQWEPERDPDHRDN
jgi:hypothetical protein